MKNAKYNHICKYFNYTHVNPDDTPVNAKTVKQLLYAHKLIGLTDKNKMILFSNDLLFFKTTQLANSKQVAQTLYVTIAGVGQIARLLKPKQTLPPHSACLYSTDDLRAAKILGKINGVCNYVAYKKYTHVLFPLVTIKNEIQIEMRVIDSQIEFLKRKMKNVIIAKNKAMQEMKERKEKLKEEEEQFKIQSERKQQEIRTGQLFLL